MKILSIDIRTNYPRGYSRSDPRVITGNVEIATSNSYAGDISHTLSPTALSMIADVILQDVKRNPPAEPDIIGVVFDEADLPPVPTEVVEPDDEPVKLAVDNTADA